MLNEAWSNEDFKHSHFVTTKGKINGAIQTASDPHAANKVLFFKVVVNNPYGELYDKNEFLELIGFTDFE